MSTNVRPWHGVLEGRAQVGSSGICSSAYVDEAIALARTAREQLPDDPDIMDTLGWLYYKKDDYERAVKFLQESVAKKANNPVSRYHLRMAYYKAGNQDRAKAELQEALQLQPDFSGVQDAREVLARRER